MKRILAGMAVFGLIVGFGSMAQAANPTGDYVQAVITVTVTDSASGLEMTVSPTIGFGTVAAGSTVMSNSASGQPRVTLRNIGTTATSIQLQVNAVNAADGNATHAWAMGSTLTDVGADRAVLAGVFTVWGSTADGGRDLVFANDFGNEDVIPFGTYTNGQATTTAFASAVDTTDDVRGINLNPGDERSMRFALVLPTSAPNSHFIQQSITITYNHF